MTGSTINASVRTPPGWMNAIMTLMLKTPVLQDRLGKTMALIAFTGRKSGKRYTTPVGYYREDDTVIVTSHKSRQWWRNLDTQPNLELRIAGTVIHGQGEAFIGVETMLPTLITFLQKRPGAAKFYGVAIGPDGKVNEDDARALLPHVVVVRVALK